MTNLNNFMKKNCPKFGQWFHGIHSERILLMSGYGSKVEIQMGLLSKFTMQGDERWVIIFRQIITF